VSSDTAQEIQFGEGGTDTHYLGAGWSGDEPGYRWSLGQRSELWLNNPGHETDLVLELALSPFVSPPALRRQSLSVFVREALVGRTELTESQTLGFRIPAAVFAAPGPVHVVFEHPDAASPRAHGHPSDSRVLAFSFVRATLRPQEAVNEAVRIEGGEIVVAGDIGRLTGMPAAQFMLRFESLGDNCEFGLVQRRCGAEPLGLLRFSNLELRQLLRGLDSGFDGLGEIANMEFWLQPGGRPEYVVRDRSYALVFHTFIHEGEANEAELLAQQSTRLKFLRRKFLDDLTNGEKIFVIKRNRTLEDTEILPLLAALRHYSPASQLLYVVPATPERLPGTVELLAPGLLRGYIDRFAPSDSVPDLSLEPWLAICVNASRLLGRDPQARPAQNAQPPAPRRDMGDPGMAVRRAGALRAVFAPRRPRAIVPDHTALYDFAARHIGPDRAIDFLEFGVASGHSIRAIADRFRSPESRFVGFDSFLGLPEPWMMHNAGAFSTGGIPPNIEDARVALVAGWFQDTVPRFLDDRRVWLAPVLVHFDADLWSSTMFLLSALWHRVPEFFFLMDDFIHDDVIALHDFLACHPAELEFFAQTTGQGDPPNPDQVFGRIRRTAFRN